MNNRIEQVSHPLDLDERIGLHKKGWRVQPVGKVLIVGIMVAAILGLFGNGWLSQQTVRTARTQLTYERFYRQDGEMKMDIATAGVMGRSAVSFPLQYLRQLDVTRVTPQPEQNFIRDGQVWYVFVADQNLQTTFHLRPKSRGNVHATIWVNEEQIPIHHFIYP